MEIADLPFLVLPRMIEVADDLYSRVRERRSAGAEKPRLAAEKPWTVRKLRPLKERDPW